MYHPVSIWRTVSHDFLGGIASIAPVIARPIQTPPSVFLAYQPSQEKDSQKSAPLGERTGKTPSKTPVLALKAPDSGRNGRRRRGGKSSSERSDSSTVHSSEKPPEEMYSPPIDDEKKMPDALLEAAKDWQPASALLYISFHSGEAEAVTQQRDRSTVVAPLPRFKYGHFSLVKVSLERDIDDKDTSKHRTVAILPSTDKALFELAPRGTGARGTPKHLIPTRAQSIYDATAVIVLYTFLVHQTYDTSEVSLHKNEIFPYFVSTNNFT